MLDIINDQGNEAFCEGLSELSFHTHWANQLKRWIIISVHMDVEKLEHSHIASGNIKGCSHFGNQHNIASDG